VTETTKWKLLAQPSKSGQRFFHRDGVAHELFVCDRSGKNPDHSEDGPLMILRVHEITAGLEARVPCFSIRVLRERGQQGELWVSLTPNEARWLQLHSKMRLLIAEASRDQLLVLRCLLKGADWNGE